MEKEELKLKIIEVMERTKLACLATIKDSKPWVRYMMFQHDQDLNCYAACFAGSRKVEQIKKNNDVHFTMGGDAANHNLTYINVEAKAQVCDDLKIKEKYWSQGLSHFFSGPQDPNYVVLVISPQVIEYMGPSSPDPQVYTVT
ncbi:MAG: pyridoxamine 5'-phosphate oxidase family protein [Candidatus Omnitrophica bacterium]|nr:pyridoxamine 5'-phosphate oxidase family protein [Candidatus Omnitrophota bacterium]